MIVHLEKFDPHGYDLLLSWVDSAESLMQFAGPTFTYPLTREQLDKSLSDENRLPFKLVGTGSEKMIGYAEIYLTPESAYLGRIIIGDPLDRGKGLGRQLVTLLVTYAFTVLAQAKVQLIVFEWNTGAIRCYEKAGFKRNLGKKVERSINGKTWTAVNMSMDREDWERIQPAPGPVE